MAGVSGAMGDPALPVTAEPAELEPGSRWLPKDLGYYLKGGGALVVDQAANLGLGLLTTLLFTNFASKEAYGNLGYVISAAGVAALAALPGVNTAIQYAAGRGFPGALAHGTRLRLKTVWLGVAGMLALAGALGLAGRASTAWCVALGALTLPLTYGCAGFAGFLQGQARFGEYALVDILIEAGKVGALALALFALRLDGVALVTAFLLATGLLTGAACLRYLRQSAGPPGAEFGRMSRAITGAAALATAAQQADRLIVGTFLGPGALAGYQLGFTLTDPLRNFGKLIAQLLFPKIVRMDASAPRFLKKFALALAALVGLLALLVVGYWIAFPFVQPLLFPQYAEALPVVRWLVVVAALSIFTTVLAQALWGLADLRPLYATQIGLPLARIACVAVGGWRLGILGILAGQVAYYGLAILAIVTLLAAAAARRRRALRQPVDTPAPEPHRPVDPRQPDGALPDEERTR
jgi:O-antigen/teichoic acid export membrane protein